MHLCVSWGRGSTAFLVFSKGSVDPSTVALDNDVFYRVFLVHFSRRNDRKLEMQREVGWWDFRNPRQAITRIPFSFVERIL